MVPAVPMKDRRFGKIVVLSREGSNHAGLAMWACRCDCGTEFVRSGAEIRSTGEGCQCRACGVQQMSESHITHGDTGTYLHTAWMGARRRVTDDKHPKWMNYGGRGITMYDRWMKDYTAYRDYVDQTLGPRPSPDHTIDRVDNDKGYEPGNIRWATEAEQLANRRRYGSRR